MVEGSLSVAVFCICAALLSVLLKQYCAEQSVLLTIAAGAAVIAGFFNYLAPVLDELRDIFYDAGLSDGYISIVFKAAAICFITQMTSDICRDCGETALSSAAELWGRGAVTFMSLPVIRALLSMVNDVI